MSKNSHAKHEHHQHHESSGEPLDNNLGPSFGDRHRKLIVIVVILFVIFGTLLFAISSILHSLH